MWRIDLHSCVQWQGLRCLSMHVFTLILSQVLEQSRHNFEWFECVMADLLTSSLSAFAYHPRFYKLLCLQVSQDIFVSFQTFLPFFFSSDFVYLSVSVSFSSSRSYSLTYSPFLSACASPHPCRWVTSFPPKTTRCLAGNGCSPPGGNVLLRSSS